MPKPGDKVRVKTKDRDFLGILMPNKESDAVIIKLASGYNIGIEKKRVKKINTISEKEAEKESPKEDKIIFDKKKKLIAVLHTGGTIASKVDYKTGGVKASFTVEDMIKMFPELKGIANIKSVLVSNMMSEDMRFMHYQSIAEAVKNEVKDNVDGIIIGHGTDTLGLTSAALAFMFDNLPIPVILVGAQRSSDRGSSDAGINLICAAEFIVNTDFAGVAVCMHEKTDDKSCLIMPPCKTRKMHTSRRDAFKVIDDEPYARVNYKTKEIKYLRSYPTKINSKLVLMDKFEEKVAIVKTYPNMFPDLIDALTEKKYKGLVLEATGIGQAPTNIEENIPNFKALRNFIRSGGTVVLTSQCIFGAVHQNIYANCRRLGNIGVIFGDDMLTETAFIKLAWLLGNYPKAKVDEMMTKNLRGEINKRIMASQYLDDIY